MPAGIGCFGRVALPLLLLLLLLLLVGEEEVAARPAFAGDAIVLLNFLRVAGDAFVCFDPVGGGFPAFFRRDIVVVGVDDLAARTRAAFIPVVREPGKI